MTTTSLRSEFAQKIRNLVAASTEGKAFGHPGNGNMSTKVGLLFERRHGLGVSSNSTTYGVLLLDEIHSWPERVFATLSLLKWCAYPTSKHPLERLGELA